MARDGEDEAKAGNRAEAVRSAVEQAFSTGAQQAGRQAEQGRERVEDIVEGLGQAAGRVREVLDDLRPPTGEDFRAVREQLAELERRVAALERRKGS